MWERFTENSRRIVFYAQEEATASGAPEVTTEHFLLALLRDQRTFAARVVTEMVSDPGLIRAGVNSAPAAAAQSMSQPLTLAEAAQRAFAIAADEARRQNYKNVGPEHLLLGIIGEGASVSARVLMQYGVDADRTRAAITKLRPTQFAPSTASAATGPGAVTTKVRPPARFTERARQILVFAREEARRFHSTTVATEHMLLGLIRDDTTVAVRALVRVGVPLATLQAEIQRQVIEAGLQPVTETPPPSRSRLERIGVNLDAIQAGIQRQVAQAKGGGSAELELTAESKTAIDLACDEAERLGHNFVGTEHLLLGLIREEAGLAARALLLSGTDLDRVREAVAAMQSEARARLLQGDSAFAAAGSPPDGVVVAGNAGGPEAAGRDLTSRKIEATPGDLGVAKADRQRSAVEVACDLAAYAQLVAILTTKDAYGYRALTESANSLFRIPDATELKLLLLPADADTMDQEACYVRILSGEFAGRAGWIPRCAFVWTGPDNSDFLPEI